MAFGIPLLFLVLLAVAAMRRRQRHGAARPGLDADHIRRIVEDGVLSYEPDEPLDEAEIAEAEEEFWEDERWDEAEEW
ncbi:MAG: hypothetical protein R3E10_08320 [Gemmatimonadota bacterium]